MNWLVSDNPDITTPCVFECYHLSLVTYGCLAISKLATSHDSMGQLGVPTAGFP